MAFSPVRVRTLCILASAVCVAGDERCPCTDAEAVFRSQADVYNETHFTWGNDILSAGSVPYPYPYTYGSSKCAAHDQALGAQCSANSSSQPGWCADAWCWVDVEKCRKSNVNVRRSTLTDWELFYSYEACGASAAEWSAAIADTNSIDGQWLKLGIPALNQLHFKMEGETRVVGSGSVAMEYWMNDTKGVWGGAMADFAQGLARWSRTEGRGMAGYTLTHSSGASRKEVSSKWTAVVLDVNLGLLDCGISDFWITTERLNLGQFTVPLFSDLLYLWVKGPTGDTDPWDTLTLVFEPFSPGLWILILCLIFVVGILDNWFQHARPTYGRHRKCFVRTNCFNKECSSCLSDFSYSAASVTYDTFMEFFSGAVDYSGLESVPSKLLRFGWAFLILILLSAYTANLAAFLSTRKLGDYLDSLDKVKLARAKVCAPTSIKNELELGFPGVNFVWVPFETEIDAYEKGHCEAIVFSTNGIKRDLPMAEKFCKNGLLAVELLLDVPVAMPCQAKYVQAMSYLMQSIGSQGGRPYMSFEQRYHQTVCPIFVQEGEVDELGQLTILNMGGALMIFSLGALLGIVLHLSAHAQKKVKRRLSTSSPNKSKNSLTGNGQKITQTGHAQTIDETTLQEVSI